MNTPAKYTDSQDDARKRIIAVLTEWRKQSETWCKSTASAVAAMAEAKERRIWEPKYTFKEFCISACGFSEAWGYKLLDCSKVISGISKYLDASSTLEVKSGLSLDILNSLTPSHTDPIREQPVAKQAHILVKAADKAGGQTPSPTQVREAKEELADDADIKAQIAAHHANQSKPKEPEVVRDKTGVPIPPKPLEYWNRRQEVQDFLTALTRIKSQVEKSREAKDLLWLDVSQDLINQLALAYAYAKDAMPYSVCTICQGWPEASKCQYCCGTGILPKHSYLRTDDRIRTLREKQYAEFVTP